LLGRRLDIKNTKPYTKKVSGVSYRDIEDGALKRESVFSQRGW